MHTILPSLRDYTGRVSTSCTVCPKSLAQFFIVYSLYKDGRNFLENQYSYSLHSSPFTDVSFYAILLFLLMHLIHTIEDHECTG